jgi:hypothetical protein
MCCNLWVGRLACPLHLPLVDIKLQVFRPVREHSQTLHPDSGRLHTAWCTQVISWPTAWGEQHDFPVRPMGRTEVPPPEDGSTASRRQSSGLKDQSGQLVGGTAGTSGETRGHAIWVAAAGELLGHLMLLFSGISSYTLQTAAGPGPLEIPPSSCRTFGVPPCRLPLCAVLQPFLSGLHMAQAPAPLLSMGWKPHLSQPHDTDVVAKRSDHRNHGGSSSSSVCVAIVTAVAIVPEKGLQNTGTYLASCRAGSSLKAPNA